MAIDVLVITALKEELDGLLTAVPGGRAAWHDQQDSQHFPYHTVELARPKGRPLRLAAAWAGAMGRMIAASRANQLIGELDARCLAICGVCAGRRHDTFLGDVIVADRVWSYDSGKATDADFYHDITTYNLEAHWSVQARYLADESAKIDGLAEVVRRRPRSLERHATWLLHHQLLHETENMPSPQTLAERPQSNDWNATVTRLEAQGLVVVERGKLRLTEAGLDQAADHRFRHPDGLPPEPKFRIHVAPIATGEAVQKDPELFARLERVGRKSLGVEMEASAIGYVAWARRIPSIVIKSVMDHGDQIKDDRFRDFACEVSARVLLGFLRIHVAIDVASARPAATARTPTQTPLLDYDAIERVLEAALQVVADSRTALLASLQPEFRAMLPCEPTPVDQLRSDLHFLNQAGRLTDGSCPLEQWLRAAKQISRFRIQEAVFDHALRLLDNNTAG